VLRRSRRLTQKAKRETQSRQQKVANPLNDLLDEAQKDIDANNFEAAVAPLQNSLRKSRTWHSRIFNWGTRTRR